jgi:hypothetical protein
VRNSRLHAEMRDLKPTRKDVARFILDYGDKLDLGPMVETAFSFLEKSDPDHNGHTLHAF